MILATRFYYNNLGDYIGQIADEDPIPDGWITYTYEAPPSIEGPSIDNPNGVLPFPIEKWDFVESKWYVPFTTLRLKTYRDIKISIQVEYNNDYVVFDVVNNIDSYTALSRICTGLPIENSGTVMWKNLDGLYHEASFSDIQELFKACYRREQDCRNAEAAVLANHLITPYIDFQDSIEDFNTEIGE